MKTVIDYNVVDHGVQNCQYFQGHGLAYTDYQDTATGAGETFNEAFEDALDSLAQSYWDVSTIINEDEHNVRANFTCEDWLGEEPAEDTYYYVSIDVKG